MQDVPVPIPRRRKRRTVPGNTENSLVRLIEIGNTARLAPDEPADVSANKDKYLAGAYAGDSTSHRQP